MTSSSVLPQNGDVIAAKYRIERMLGSGGMGAVFEATHRVTGKRFAIKWLLPDLSGHEDVVKRFIREAQVAGRFQHPNVVEVYDIGQEGDSFYMVMELLEGESLAARLERTGRMAPEEACRMLLPCMLGVARAHAAGIVHRDLKPANIFVCRATPEQPERPTVLDFGISKMSSLGELDPSMTKTGVVMGTPHYMSPEQVRGRAVDHRADIYAFGVILYQLVTGELPFDATTYSELVLQIATETPKPLSDLVPDAPAGFAQLISRAMARDPAERFQTVEELVRALGGYAGGARFGAHSGAGHASPAHAAFGATVPLDTPLTSESRPSLPSSAKRARRAVGWSALAVLAGVVVLVLIVLSLLPGEPDAAPQVERGASPDALSGRSGKAAPAVPRAAAGRGQAPAQQAEAARLAPVDPSSSQRGPGSDPQPKTVRVEPEPPAPARAWQPPADEPPGAGGNRPERRAAPKAAPVQTAAQDEAPTQGAARKPRRVRPQSRSTATPTAEPGAAPRKPAGRLGISMDEAEF